MTSREQSAGNRRRFEPWETGLILDHYVSGFEWTIPSRLDVVDFMYPELFLSDLHGQPMLVFSGAPPLARISAGPGLLEDFLKVESAPDDAILAYPRWAPYGCALITSYLCRTIQNAALACVIGNSMTTRCRRVIRTTTVSPLRN
jgi:hypothetical protein